MHPSTFETAADDLVRAARSSGPDLAYHLSGGLNAARLSFGSAEPLTGDDQLRIAEAIPMIEHRFAPIAVGFVPADLLPRCFDALEAAVRLWAEPAAVRRASEPNALAEANALLRILQNAAHSVVLADDAMAAAERRRRVKPSETLVAGPRQANRL